MSYDKYDGVTLGNQIGHEFEYNAFYAQLRKRVNFIKSLNLDNVIGAINGIQNMIENESNIEQNISKKIENVKNEKTNKENEEKSKMLAANAKQAINSGELMKEYEIDK